MQRNGQQRIAEYGSDALKIESVNFEPALVLRAGERLESLFVFETDGEVISGIRVVRNPDKLARIDRQLSTINALAPRAT